MLKLTAALPADRRQDEVWVRQRFHLDASGWKQGDEQMPHLSTIHEAVWSDRRLYITFRTLAANKLERLVDPYGLVAKAGVWYLVGARNEVLHVYRVSELINVHLTDDFFVRPAGFDLAAFWAEWCVQYEQMLVDFTAVVRVAPDFVPVLPRYFGSAIRHKIAQAPPDEAGWITLELSFSSFFAARDRLLGFGRAVQVLDPIALQRSLLDFAEQIVGLYT